ncbi:MAG: adenylosuccinate synthetase [Clostridia bacterium]|nr:MAG: adenylosuccinate synthetase [Clostridia bacterium]
MPVVIVVGGQYGGEGKGKMTAHLCRRYGFDAAVRCGGPNSGHTITLDGRQVVLRQIPAGVVNPGTALFLAAGCLVDLEVLFAEIARLNLSPERLRIDHHAVVIEKAFVQEERGKGLNDRIGSTCTGTGVAVARRALRSGDLRLARDVPELAPYLTTVSEDIMARHSRGEKIVIEGTQGFGLSVYHSPYYPYATSRDTTASGFLSEAGLSPLVVSDVLMVIRTFPIRVGGNSGPLPGEIDWETVRQESGYPYGISELTTVTQRLRRVGRFDVEIVKKAALANLPTRVALMGVDYLNYRNKGASNFGQLALETQRFIFWLQREIGGEIGFIGTGPADDELIDRLGEWKSDQKGALDRAPERPERIPVPRV